jgi:LysM repeat protein
MTHKEYIKKYSPMAVNEMKRSGVPASITLSQGILESGSGNSYLATTGNNHFGIKCGGKWDGAKIYSDDDEKNECFRKYKSVEESYRDHSDFLKNNVRYSFLFELKTTDYKGWAKGLKKAGYATSPTYAEKLIELIERYELNKYDKGSYNIDESKPVVQNTEEQSGSGNVKRPVAVPDNFNVNLNEYEVLSNNNTAYIIIKKDIDISTLAKEINLMPWQIRNYNDLDKNDLIRQGDVIYMKPKKNRAEKGFETHIIQQGETMWTVSQKYGIKLKKLYSKNNIEFGIEPVAGTELSLRKNKR